MTTSCAGCGAPLRGKQTRCARCGTSAAGTDHVRLEILASVLALGLVAVVAICFGVLS